MSLYIGPHSKQFGRVKTASAHGHKGAGIYSLYLSLGCAVNLSDIAYISQLQCRIELSETRQSIGAGFPEGAPIKEWHSFNTEEQLGFYFHLTGEQITAIEQYRSAGDLILSIWLSGVTTHQEETEAFYGKEDFRIPQQQWVQALRNMGYIDKLLYEIPIPLTNNEQIKGLISKAQKHILNGHYDEAVSQCRLLFEVFETADDYKKDARAAANQFRDKRTDMTIAQRVMFAREAVKNITHMSAHFTGEDTFSRTQAISALNLTLAVLAPEEGNIV